MPHRLTRREMLRSSAFAGIAVWTSATRGTAAEGTSPNERLDVAVIGCGGRGASNLQALSSQNIVALCDVDDRRAGGAFVRYGKARTYRDFRTMFDEMADNKIRVDAVVVSTPDHCHAPASLRAMALGKHVYCEKPLTYSVDEARQMTKMAERQKVATQMGTQHHCTEGYRRSVEIIQSGALGEVREVHCWTDRPSGWWPQGVARPKEKPPVPNGLDWDLWLGPAPTRPYHDAYLPFKWRGWWDFGTGAMGDMAIHICNVAYWALKLGPPASVEVEHSPEAPNVFAETYPRWCTLKYHFPARGELPPADLTWYDAGRKPPAELAKGMQLPANGTLFVGEDGSMFAPIGEAPTLLPKEKFAGFQGPDPTLPRLPEIHQTWIESCKTGQPAGCHFGYAGPMTESLLVGNLALRLQSKIEWDAVNRKVKNCPEADKYIAREPRKGWEFPANGG